MKSFLFLKLFSEAKLSQTRSELEAESRYKVVLCLKLTELVVVESGRSKESLLIRLTVLHEGFKGLVILVTHTDGCTHYSQ